MPINLPAVVRMDLGVVVEADVADEFDAHVESPVALSNDEKAVAVVARELLDQAVFPVEVGLGGGRW